MTSLIRAQLLGMHTLRSTYLVPVGLVALVAVIAYVELSDAGTKGLTTPTQLRDGMMAGAGIMTALALALLAATRVAGEYRYHTVTQRLLASPRRARVLTAELLTYGGVALIVAAATLGTALAIAQPLVASKHLTLGLSVGLVLSDLLVVVLFTMLGVIIAVISRSQPVAVGALIGGFFAEKILGLFVGDGAAYLPYALLNPLLGFEGATISRGTAALTLTGMTLVLALIAYALLRRRDVT